MFEGVFLIFCFLMIGFGLKLAKKDYSDVLIQFCILVAFPALILQKLYPLKLAFSDISIVAIAIFSILFGFFVGYLLSRFLKLEKKSAAVVIMACGLGNTSFVGFPFVEALYGTHALVYALLFDQFGSFLFLSIFGSMIAAWGAGRDSSVKKLAKSVLLFPPFVAILLSLVLKAVELPSFVLLGADKLAVTLLPLVTIAVGMKIDLRHIKENIKNTLAILVVKMGVVPLAVLAVLPALGVASGVALIESAMPPMVMVAVFAMRYGLDEKLAVSAVALGVFASFAVVPLFYYLG
jgi:malate permease and related proteins